MPALAALAAAAAVVLRSALRRRVALADLVDECLVCDVLNNGRAFVRAIPRAADRLRAELSRPLYVSDANMLCDDAEHIVVAAKRAH